MDFFPVYQSTDEREIQKVNPPQNRGTPPTASIIECREIYKMGMEVNINIISLFRAIWEFHLQRVIVKKPWKKLHFQNSKNINFCWFLNHNFLLGMKFQNCFDEANCIDKNFYSLSYILFFTQRLRLRGGATIFREVNFLYFTFVCRHIGELALFSQDYSRSSTPTPWWPIPDISHWLNKYWANNMKVKRSKTPIKSNRDQPTNRPMDKAGCRVRSVRLKKFMD